MIKLNKIDTNKYTIGTNGVAPFGQQDYYTINVQYNNKTTICILALDSKGNYIHFSQNQNLIDLEKTFENFYKKVQDFEEEANKPKNQHITNFDIILNKLLKMQEKQVIPEIDFFAKCYRSFQRKTQRELGF